MDADFVYTVGDQPMYPDASQAEETDVKVASVPALADVSQMDMPTMPPPEVRVQVTVERVAPVRGRLYLYALAGLLTLSLFMTGVTFALYWHSVNSFLLLLAFIVSIVCAIAVGATLLYYRTMRSFVFSTVMTAVLFVDALAFGMIPGVVVYKQASESFGALFGTLPGVAQVFLVFFFPTSFAIVCALWALYFLETRHRRRLSRMMCNDVARKVAEATGKPIPPSAPPQMQEHAGEAKGEPIVACGKRKGRGKKRRRR